MLADLRRGLRRPVCVGSQPAEEAHPVRGFDHAGCRQARRHDRRSGSPDRCSRRSVGADGPAIQRVRGPGPGPRLRPRPVGIQRVPRRPRLSPERRARSARQGAVLRHPGVPGRRRDLRGSDHQRARPGARRAGPGDRRSVCDGQHHRHRDGPELPRRWRQHRQHDDLRLRRGPSRRAVAHVSCASEPREAGAQSTRSWACRGTFTSARRKKSPRRCRRNPLASGRTR